MSQTEIEQHHIADALTFELSKVETPEIRTRMVSHLLNIDQDLATSGGWLRLKEMPRPADAAKPTQESEDLSGPEYPAEWSHSFTGRKIGALVTDGVDINILKALKTAVKEEGALLEIVAPQVGGVEASDGSWIEATQKLDGGPSVLYDAVALLPSEDGARSWRRNRPRVISSPTPSPIASSSAMSRAAALLGKAGIPEGRDDGFILLKGRDDCSVFVTACRQLRYWARRNR